MSEKDGGAAFPVLEPFEQYDDNAGCYRQIYQPLGGMKLRDYFAAHALQGLIGSEIYMTEIDRESKIAGMPDGQELNIQSSVVSKTAYRIADAMLKARG